MNIKDLSEKIQSIETNGLRDFCFENIDRQGLFLIKELIDRYRNKSELDVAIIISQLLNTELSHWEGKDLFEISFYIEVLNIHPHSEIILTSLLSFYLPPYSAKEMDFFDKEHYKLQLQKVNPSHKLLSIL